MDEKINAEAVPEQRTSTELTQAAPVVSAEATTAFDPSANTEDTSAGQMPASEPPAGEAEPLLLKSYQGMKEREKTIPPQGKVRLTEAVDRLIDLYTATNKPDEVKKWRAEQAKPPEAAPMPGEKK